MKITLKGDLGTVEIEADQRVPTGLISPYPSTNDLLEGAITLYKAMGEQQND